MNSQHSHPEAGGWMGARACQRGQTDPTAVLFVPHKVIFA